MPQTTQKQETYRVSLDVSAEVTITKKMVVKYVEQYVRYDNQKGKERMVNNILNDIESKKELAQKVLYAFVNPNLPIDSDGHDYYWDGVANLKGLIKRIEVSTD